MPTNRHPIVIPASPQEAEARLVELGPLATAIEWERGFIVYALTKPGRSGPQNSASFGRLSFSRFAEKGIHGLRSHTSVSAYWRAVQRAIDAGIAPEVTLGDEVELPEVAWSDFYSPKEANVDDVLTEAIGADPRAVANAAWAVLKEGREIEAERNADLVKQAREDKIRDLMERYGCTRKQAEERRLLEQRPVIAEANRKAKRAEIRALHRLAERAAEIVGIVTEAVNAGDAELLGEKQRTELQEASDVLQKVINDVEALLWGGLEKLLDSDEDDES
jgi:hypothetical protein